MKNAAEVQAKLDRALDLLSNAEIDLMHALSASTDEGRLEFLTEALRDVEAAVKLVEEAVEGGEWLEELTDLIR